jgi:hypothetical protein
MRSGYRAHRHTDAILRTNQKQAGKNRRRLGRDWSISFIGASTTAVGTFAVAVLALAGCSRKVETDGLNWQEIVSSEGRFRVQMPGQPRKEVRKVGSQTGQVTDTLFELQTKDWSMAVRYADFDAAEQQATDLDEIIRAGRDSTVKALKGVVAGEKAVQLGAFSGKEVIVDVPNRGHSRLRWYVVNRRIYTLIFMSNRVDSTLPDIARFFGSFQLSK